jgi:hypothetical protein
MHIFHMQYRFPYISNTRYLQCFLHLTRHQSRIVAKFLKADIRCCNIGPMRPWRQAVFMLYEALPKRRFAVGSTYRPSEHLAEYRVCPAAVGQAPKLKVLMLRAEAALKGVMYAGQHELNVVIGRRSIHSTRCMMHTWPELRILTSLPSSPLAGLNRGSWRWRLQMHLGSRGSQSGRSSESC